MKIKKIVKGVAGIEIKGNKDLEIHGLSSHSKLVHPKDLFIAKKSKHFSTQDFIDDAVKSGAIAIVTDLYNPFLNEIVQIIHVDPSMIEAQLASNFYAHTQEIQKYFITGTNGKTTTCFMLDHLLELQNKKSALLTTIVRKTAEHEYRAKLTTKDLISNYKDFNTMFSEGCTHAVVEASSHGLCQKRLENITCKAAIFTNLSHDHLDYHSNMQEYLEAKLRLLQNLHERGVAIYNLDCPYFSRVDFKCTTLSFSLTNPKADLFVQSIDGPWVLINFQGQEQEIFFDHPGQHNLSNALASMLALLYEKVALSEFKYAFKQFCLPKGRLEKVVLSNGARVFIDFAHTPKALEATLLALKQMQCSKLWLVFGCGGNRDKQKRAMMTDKACQFADHLVFTSDNPRDEPFDDILAQMLKGLDQHTDYEIIEDRKDAIHFVLKQLKPDEILCVAGKGHEEEQIIGSNIGCFNDKIVVQKLLKDLDLVHV